MQDSFGEKDGAANRKISTYTPNVRLRRARELRGWSQADVAEKIEAQPRLVTRWETGHAFPSPYYRQKLCSLFEQNAEELGLIKGSSNEIIEDVQPVAPVISASTTSIHDEESEFVERASGAEIRGARPAFYTRRKIVLGVVGGGAVVVSGGLWFLREAQQNRSLPRSSSLELTTLYIYRPDSLKYVNYVEWSPRGNFLACAVGDNKIRVLEATSGHINCVYNKHNGYTNSVSWAPDETRIASASGDKTVQVWRPLTGELLLTYRGHSDAVYCVSWAHDGRWIASSGRDTTVQVWDSVTGKLVKTYYGHTKPVWNVAWSPDDSLVATGGEDGILRLWGPLTAKESSTFVYQGPHGSKINEIAWSPDGRSIVSAPSDTTIRIWDAHSGAQVREYTHHTASVMTARWAPNGKLIASGGLDNTVQIWNATTGEQLARDLEYRDEIFEVSWAPDSKRLATASKDTTMHVYQVVLAKVR